MNDSKIKIIENEYSIIIENKEYYIYESYILNGSGYTFRIYKNSKRENERKNCFFINDGEKIVLVGKKYNYLLIKITESFEYNITKYNKDILRLDFDYKKGNNYLYLFKSIYLNDKTLVIYGDNINNPDIIFSKEIELRKKIIRKKKISKITNESSRI